MGWLMKYVHVVGILWIVRGGLSEWRVCVAVNKRAHGLGVWQALSTVLTFPSVARCTHHTPHIQHSGHPLCILWYITLWHTHTHRAPLPSGSDIQPPAWGGVARVRTSYRSLYIPPPLRTLDTPDHTRGHALQPHLLHLPLTHTPHTHSNIYYYAHSFLCAATTLALCPSSSLCVRS